MATQKTQIQKGSRVLVKTRDPYGYTRCREARVIDAHRDCLKVEYKWWVFRWSKWLQVKDDRRTVEFISANETALAQPERKGGRNEK